MIFVEHVGITQTPGQIGYSVEASTLGLGPGDWPVVLSATDAAGMPFELKRHLRTGHGDPDGFVYMGNGYKLTVFND